ncbi:MAG: 2-phospho-L-lactate guanylyltransferase [Pseudomonadales bacterium]
MWAVVPFKGSAGAKCRLASHLSAEERRELVTSMLDDVLHALTNSQLLKGVVVVSRASEAARFAHRHGVELYADRADDLSGAVVEAGHHVANIYGATGTFFVPGDIPLITAEEIDAAIKDHLDVTIIPDRNDIGTNGVLSSPPNAFRYLFDGKSFKPHQHEATQAGYQPRVLRLSGFSLDIDTIDDLIALAQEDRDIATLRFLKKSGIASGLFANDNRFSTHDRVKE